MAEARISYKKLEGRGIPVRGNDIDTDRIIPARYMKAVTFEGLGAYAFYDARFNEDGTHKAHNFNEQRFSGAEVLLVNKNFGCGSSREHAPQALQKFGIRAIIGESFAEIFAGNCTAMGIPAVKVSADDIARIMGAVEANPKLAISIDLEKQKIGFDGIEVDCSMPPAYRNSLVAGTWDSMGVLLENLEGIKKVANTLPYVNGYAAT